MGGGSVQWKNYQVKRCIIDFGMDRINKVDTVTTAARVMVCVACVWF